MQLEIEKNQYLAGDDLIVGRLSLEAVNNLQSALIRTILSAISTELLVANNDLTVVAVSPGLNNMLDKSSGEFVGCHLLKVFPELIGYEDNLSDIAATKVRQLQLPMINYPDQRDRLRYFDLTVQPYPDPKLGWLLVLITDVTEKASMKQQIIQQRNQLQLLSKKLLDWNNELDYVLRRYVPADVVEAIINGQMSFETGGELREVTVLFADMRGYTRVARNLPADKVMAFLNDYLHVVSEAIAETDGTIAQYMGDAIMAIFNGVIDQPNHAWKAVEAGFHIQRAIAEYNEIAATKWGNPIGVGVGICTGPALVGNTGAEWQCAFSAIGNTTNMAYRLTMLARQSEIYIGEETYQAVKDHILATSMPPLEVKGLDRPIPSYRVKRLC